MKQAFMRLLCLTVTAMLTGFAAFAQVTTSSISGHVYDNVGDVAGAAVIAVHAPSGTEYHAVTDKFGNYRIHNMRVGGPYTLTVDMLGYGQVKTENIALKLGETFVWDVELKEEALSLDAVTISAEAENTVMTSEKSGTSANFSRRQLTTLPTGSRTINDVVKLTPQSNGMSFGGRDSRYNNFSVDGAGFNNNFGLSSDLPGGDSGPISFDAIEEISVNMAPYDVRQSRFTGASINAVTKSGTNEFDGSFYTYQKFPGMNGGRIGDVVLDDARDITSQTYGLSIGGPIIKNKLFFFVNGEYSPVSNPGPSWQPSTDGVGDADNGISRTSIADLERVKNHLINTYGYDPGTYGEGGWGTFSDYTYKIMARIDWNINDNHRLMIRYNDVLNSVMNNPNGNSCPPNLYRDRSVDRLGPESMAFSKNFYRQNNGVRSIAVELNSKFSEKVSNQLLATANFISDKRDPQSEIFPHVDIYKDGKQYMSFGLELFSYNNAVINNTVNVTDNVTINLNRHTITAGASFEYMFVKNSYIREGTSYYRYASVDDFINNATPTGFGITYGFNGEDAPGQLINYAQASVYAQDEWEINRKFKLTYGLRLEMPFYLDNDMLTNTEIFRIGNENNFPGGAWDTRTWPKSYLTVNPRVGFNWDILGDRSLQLRGGTGIFSGLNPFVWFVNQTGAAGFVQSQEMGIVNPDFKFDPDYKNLIASRPDLFVQDPDMGYLAPGSNIAMVDKNFKFPQVWRSNIAVDVRLPWNMVFTAEALYSKDIFGVRQINANYSEPDGQMFGADKRSVWNPGTSSTVTDDVATAILLTNANKGYTAQFTGQLTKNFSNGFTGMIAYTYSDVKSIASNGGSSANSAWTSGLAVNSMNSNELGWSSYSVPHRVVASLSYRIDYARNFATTVSLFYQGSHNGRISYIYGGDVNGDGYAADLMYVPANGDEIEFVDLVKTVEGDGGVTSSVVLASAEDQEKAFFEYIDGNRYLRNHKGKYVERYGGLQKWVNEFDVKILQDIYTNFGTNNRYSLQLSLDILNVGNLLNSNWGNRWTSRIFNDQNVSLLSVASKGTTTEAPKFTLNTVDPSSVAEGQGVTAFHDAADWTRVLNAANCWSMLLGIRLTF